MATTFTGDEMAGQDSARLHRRGFITGATAGLATAFLAGSADLAANAAEPDDDAMTALAPDAALRILLDGNRRWVRGRARHPRQSVRRRHALVTRQDPFALVLSCIDSRVPPELVFDCGLGDIFVIRTGAQVLDRGIVLGSLEFGPVKFPSTRLIIVVGHQGCGAVAAAISVIESGKPAPGHIQAVVDALRPAYRVAKPMPGDLLENMIKAQTRLAVDRLRADRHLHDLPGKHRLLIVGGHYELRSGRVALIA